jgi:hypothetical protein
MNTMTDREWTAIKDCLEASMNQRLNIYGETEEMLRASYDRMACCEDFISMCEVARNN